MLKHFIAYFQITLLIIFGGCSSVLPKDGYYVRTKDYPNEVSALRIDNNRIRFEYGNSDTTYITPFYEIKKEERNYFKIEKIYLESEWESYTLKYSLDRELSEDSIRLDIEIPSELDCSFYLLIELDCSNTNAKERYFHILESGKNVSIKFPAPPDFDEMYKNEGFEDIPHLDDFGWPLCVLRCNFLWKPEILLKYQYLPHYFDVTIYYPPRSKTDYIPNAFYFSFNKLIPIIWKLPIYRSMLFTISSKSIFFGSEEFRRQ